MRFHWLIYFIAIMVLIPVSFARAQTAEIFHRDGYDRLVVDGVIGSVSENQQGTVSFTVSGSDLVNAINAIQSQAVSEVKNSGTSVTINFHDYVTQTRHFKIANRLLLDMYFSKKQAEQATAEPADQKVENVIKPVTKPMEAEENKAAIAETPTTTPDENVVQEVETTTESVSNTKPKDAIIDEAVVENAVQDTTPTPSEAAVTSEATTVQEGHNTSPELVEPEIAETLETVEEEATPTLSITDTAPPYAQPTVITVSSTERFSLAVFERFNRLFIVTDDDTLKLPPQISGAGKTLGWSLKSVPMASGQAWMMPIPAGGYAHVEGGGVVWRIILSEKQENLTSASVSPNFDNMDDPAVVIGINEPTDILKLVDPDYGDALAVLTVDKAENRLLDAFDFIDFSIIPAISGVVIKPQSDGVKIATIGRAIKITKSTGLLVSPMRQDEIAQSFMAELNNEEDGEATVTNNRFFFFEDWKNSIQGQPYVERRQALSDQLSLAETDEDELPILFNLVKMHLADDMGAEALGYLDIIDSQNDNIRFIPQYWALKGAAHYLAGQYDMAIESLSDDLIANNSEIILWRAAALAANEQYEEAFDLYRQDADISVSYPVGVKLAVLAPLMEALIADGMGAEALEMIDYFKETPRPLTKSEYAALTYLRGKAQMMAGYPEKANENLQLAVNAEPLGPYGARAELSLIKAQKDAQTLSVEEAINRMERLRFIWRGDDLEIDIYDNLGLLYIESGDSRRGLGLLQKAAELTDDPLERRSFVRYMAEVYEDIFMGDLFETLDPMQAVSVYDEFRELMPVGPVGDQIINRLVDKLIEIDLMSRAVSVLQDKMERLEYGEEAIRTGLRIAAIQLIDRRPEAAMETLIKVDGMLRAFEGDQKFEFNQKVIKLKARSFADMGQHEAALFMTEGLPDTSDVLSLRIDTAWAGGEWVAAADNLQKLIEREGLINKTELTNREAKMILNQAVALQLSGQDNDLRQFALDYDEVMDKTPLSKTFKVVTRPINNGGLADRETLLDMTSEVDLFPGFLNENNGL